jgi:hypothetical protein
VQLPKAEQAIVDLEKVSGYLLSETHPVGKAKAAFFKGLGFTPERPLELVWALQQLGRSGSVVDQEENRFGTKFVVEGILSGSLGSARVSSVWFAATPSASPRLVTAYPSREQK